MLLRLLFEDIRLDDLFLDVVGKPDGLPVNRYPQAVAIALALRHSWQRDDLITFSKRLGVKVTSKDLADTHSPSRPIRRRPRRRRTGRARRRSDIALGTRRAAHGHTRGRRAVETDREHAANRVRASRTDSRARLVVVKALRCASTPPARGYGLDERLGRAPEGNYVMPGRFCPAANRIAFGLLKEKPHVRHIDHAQHRSDDRSADAPLPRLHHDCACRTRRPIHAHALRRPAQGRRRLRGGPRALDATKPATPSRLVLIDTAELGWQRARCRSRAHRLTPADPVLVGLNTLQQWLWQRLQIPIATPAHA